MGPASENSAKSERERGESVMLALSHGDFGYPHGVSRNRAGAAVTGTLPRDPAQNVGLAFAPRTSAKLGLTLNRLVAARGLRWLSEARSKAPGQTR